MVLSAAVVAACASCCAPSLFAEQVSRTTKRTATIHWQKLPLRDAVARLRGVFDETIFVDRRVDPSKRVSLDAEVGSAIDVLTLIASENDLGVIHFGKAIYLGPVSTSEKLRTLATVRGDEIYALPGNVRSPLERRRELSWPRLTEPRTLIESIVRDRGWRVEGADRIPHDLWPAGSLPPIALAEQLTILLAGFDLTFNVRASDRTIKIVPIDGPITVHRRYRLPETFDQPAAVLQQQFPDARATVENGVAAVDARVEDHDRLAELLAKVKRGRVKTPKPREPKIETKQVYTLRVQDKPVGAVLKELANRLKWQIEFDDAKIRAAGISTDALISFTVENVDQDVVLKELLKPARLDFRREGERIIIIPRE